MNINLFKKSLRYVYLHGWLYRRIDKTHRRRINNIKSRGTEVRVVFMAMSVSMWRYQHLYELMDSTSTVASLIPFLKEKQKLQILTNGLKTAEECGTELPDASVYIIGGMLMRRIDGTVGLEAIEAMESYRPDILFFSAKGISIQDGVQVLNEEGLHVKRSMMRISRTKVLLLDSRKFTRSASRVLCSLHDLDYVITEKDPGEEWRKAVSDAGVKLVFPRQAE